MANWNLYSFLLVVATLIQAYSLGWKRPKLVSFATITALWFVGSFALWMVS